MIIEEDKIRYIMPGKKGMQWKKPKANKKKLNTSILNKTFSKIRVLSQVGKKLKKKDWSTPSAMASTIIEENVDKYFEKIDKSFEDTEVKENKKG